jgi:RNA polymerase sigma factor (TIGR02999 family)
MRLLLIDYARKRLAKKRGGNLSRVVLVDSIHNVLRDEDSILVMDEALGRLGSIDARALRVVELKFFAGCTNDETAEILGCSDGTVEAVWLHARLWLHRELTRANNAATLRSA